MLKLDSKIVESCREAARVIAEDVQKTIDAHTTDTIERTILRLLGVDGADAFDVPLVNVVIDHIKEKGDLSKGVVHYLANAVAETGATPKALALAIAEGDVDLTRYDAPEKVDASLLDDAMAPMLQTIKKQRLKRLSALKDKTASAPEKYVIVATGNIHEDIEQAISAVALGADIIAVIRTTGQSLLDYVPEGLTREGFGGTYATQDNIRLMRQALDDAGKEAGRYVKLVNYASGLCMPEIAAIGALERLDMMLNDSLYGIIFRDINMKRTFIDQYFSRVISAYADITINTGEDNYLTTADAFDEAHTVTASQFINEQFAAKAHMDRRLMGLGHAYEIDPEKENSFLYEYAQALLARTVFPDAPLKYMPPTKYMSGDIFKGVAQNTLFNIATVATGQKIHLLGMLTEAIHTPFMSDRAIALENADYVERAFRGFQDAFILNPDGLIVERAKEVLAEAESLLHTIKAEGMFAAIAKGRFANVSRTLAQGKGLSGVTPKHAVYQNPVMDAMLTTLKEENDG